MSNKDLSLSIALIALIVAILTFIFANKNAILRYILGSLILIAALYLGYVGVTKMLNAQNGDEPTKVIIITATKINTEENATKSIPTSIPSTPAPMLIAVTPTPTNIPPTSEPALISTIETVSGTLINRISLSSAVPLAPIISDIIKNPSQISTAQLENVVRRIQAEADILHSGRFDKNSTEIPPDNWWLIWCSDVPSKYYNGLPSGWNYLFEQSLPTFGQLYVVSPTSENRKLFTCNSPEAWWGVVIYISGQ